MKMYGLINNRFEENRNYNDDKLIHEGDDITKYLWSDRNCYYVTKVVDQKHIFVKPYHVCADHSKKGGMGHQDWMYFKSRKEEDEYLKQFFPNEEYPTEYKDEPEIELVFRYNKWRQKVTTWFGQPLDKPRYNEFGNISFGVRDYHYDWEF